MHSHNIKRYLYFPYINLVLIEFQHIVGADDNNAVDTIGCLVVPHFDKKAVNRVQAHTEKKIDPACQFMAFVEQHLHLLNTRQLPEKLLLHFNR